ncbi:MAG: hypothetical protein KW788_00775 [Candidatus Doudnabacteria bacterium]|nr:hypothetical protein [Candidatus Doudnabacteria bacterium]
MAKKRKKFHKIVIHPNRYLLWAVAVMVITAAALVSYIYVTNITTDLSLRQETNMAYWHSYKDANLSLRYPADWLVDVGTGYIGFGPKNDDAFLVYSYSPPNDPAYDSYSKLAATRAIMVDGLVGIRVPTDPNTSQKIAFVKTSKRLYEFRGTTNQFDAVLNSVRFLKK